MNNDNGTARTSGVRHWGRWVSSAAVATAVIVVVVAARPWSNLSAGNAAVSSSANQTTAAQITRTSGDSIVNSYDPTYPTVHLEVGPYLCSAGEQTGCGSVDSLNTGDEVIMRCWEDTSPPGGQTPPPGMAYTSPRWFYVNDVNGDRPGYSGFVYSELVETNTQISTPACTWPLELQYQYPAPSGTGGGTPTLTITGSCTTAGGALSAGSSGFTPGGGFTVSATYPDGAAYPLASTSGTVSDQGTVPWTWPCAGDPAGQYTTTVTDNSAGVSVSAQFTIGAAPSTGVLPAGSGVALQPTVELARGGAAPAGSWYVITLQGFAAQAKIDVTCYDSVSPQGFITFAVSTNGAGDGGTSTGCYSGDGPDHWVVASGADSNHVTWSSGSAAPPTTPAPPPPPPATYSETVGGQTHTWTNYANAGGYEGATISPYTTVQITCRVQGFKVADGNTWWYRIASSPWNDQYYASADAFYNNGATSGSLLGTPWDDPAVPLC